MSNFIKGIKLPDNVIGVFEDDGDTGYIYIYSPKDREVYVDLIVYQVNKGVIEPNEEEIKIVYSNDAKKLGVYVFSKLRGYIDIANERRERKEFFVKDDEGILDIKLSEQLSSGINEEINIDKSLFIEDRKKYWKEYAEFLKKQNSNK